MASELLLKIMAYATAMSFPILMVITLLVFFAKKCGSAFLQSKPVLRRTYDRLIEIGPKEGWSGYIIGSLVFLWLGVMAALIMTTITAGNPHS